MRCHLANLALLMQKEYISHFTAETALQWTKVSPPPCFNRRNLESETDSSEVTSKNVKNLCCLILVFKIFKCFHFRNYTNRRLVTLTPQDQAQNDQGVVRAAKEKLAKNHPRNQEDVAMAGRVLEVVEYLDVEGVIEGVVSEIVDLILHSILFWLWNVSLGLLKLHIIYLQNHFIQVSIVYTCLYN